MRRGYVGQGRSQPHDIGRWAHINVMLRFFYIHWLIRFPFYHSAVWKENLVMFRDYGQKNNVNSRRT